MKQVQRLPIGQQLNKIQNLFDGWAHVHPTEGYKTFYSVAIHHFEGVVEHIQTFAMHADAVDYQREWNDGIIGDKQG